MLANFTVEFIGNPIGPTGGHEDTTVAQASQPIAPTRGQEGKDKMEIDSDVVQQDQNLIA